jgi:hypothetical protein
LLPALAAVALLMTVAAAPVRASEASSVAGGGRGTVDGVTAFSQFGFKATVHDDGSVTGSFNCLMAGATEVPGF